MMITKHLGRLDYELVLRAMQTFTLERGPETPDELWICEHPAVYTLGLSAQPMDGLQEQGIPWVQSNRGGQITYHGPGQVVAYPLLDLQRRGYFVKEYVHRLEEAVIKCLNDWGVSGYRVPGAPGVYVNPQEPQSHATWASLQERHPNAHQGARGTERDGTPASVNFAGLAKIAALGVKVSRHCTYHGLALNVAMDLTPFSAIHPCGYPGLQVTDCLSLGLVLNSEQAGQALADKLGIYLAP